MTLSILNSNTQLICPYTFCDNSTLTVVQGPFTSISDISITAKNILIIGNITSEGRVSLSAKNIFVIGVIQANQLHVSASENRYNGITDETLEALNRAGISLTYDRSSNRIIDLQVLPLSTDHTQKVGLQSPH